MNDNQSFYRAFNSLEPSRQAEILRDTARFYREERGTPQAIKQAEDLEHEAFCIENWQSIINNQI